MRGVGEKAPFHKNNWFCTMAKTDASHVFRRGKKAMLPERAEPRSVFIAAFPLHLKLCKT